MKWHLGLVSPLFALVKWHLGRLPTHWLLLSQKQRNKQKIVPAPSSKTILNWPSSGQVASIHWLSKIFILQFVSHYFSPSLMVLVENMGVYSSALLPVSYNRMLIFPHWTSKGWTDNLCNSTGFNACYVLQQKKNNESFCSTMKLDLNMKFGCCRT